MARPISDTHRRISAGFIGSYLGKRNQCLRDVVLWMLAGPDSTRSGLLRVHVGALADDLGHSKPAVIDALTRLHADGHIVWDADNRTALCWFVIRNVTLPAETNRKSYLTECNVFNDCPPRTEAKKWIEAIEITVANGAQRRQQSSYLSQPLSSAQQRTENREQRTESASVAKATDTPALPDVASELPDPWDKLAQEYSNPTANRPDFRIAPTLTPEAALRLAKADAVRKGILPPEPQQLAMDLPAGKPKRELTDGQLDAIFAKKRLAEIVNHWNEVMASKNAPCDFKSVAAKATVLVGNLAKYKHRDCLDDARCLFDWSVAVDKYHSGQAGKLWTLQGWLSAEHLSAVFAAYRQHRGDAKMLTMDLDRTIRHWRLEVEAAELNNKLAAAKNEAA